MSKYTTEVRFICETLNEQTESSGYSDVSEIISNVRTKIFDFDYPIFDESYRETLETKILTHYYTREIGFETVGLWKLKLCAKMNDIMPYYNQLYESAKLEFDPLGNKKYVRHMTTKDDGTLDTTGNAENETKNAFSDTPQGALTDVENLEYLTDYRNIKGESSDSRNTVNDSFQDLWETIDGKDSYDSFSKLLEDYRKTFRNIDLMIINELNDLFMLIW